MGFKARHVTLPNSSPLWCPWDSLFRKKFCVSFSLECILQTILSCISSIDQFVDTCLWSCVHQLLLDLPFQNLRWFLTHLSDYPWQFSSSCVTATLARHVMCVWTSGFPFHAWVIGHPTVQFICVSLSIDIFTQSIVLCLLLHLLCAPLLKCVLPTLSCEWNVG